jgi:hypothetical protein
VDADYRRSGIWNKLVWNAACVNRYVAGSDPIDTPPCWSGARRAASPGRRTRKSRARPARATRELMRREGDVARFRTALGGGDNPHVQAAANFGEQHALVGEEREPGGVGQQPRRLAAEHRHGERVPRQAVRRRLQLRVRHPRAVGREDGTVLALSTACELHGLAVWQELDVDLPAAQEKSFRRP